MACAGPGRCVRHTTNRFHYQYSAPVTRACTRLRLLPRPCHRDQRVIRADLAIDPRPRRARSFVDRFGNCVVEVEHDRLSAHLEVTVEICVAPSEAGEGCGTCVDLLTPEAVAEARALYLSATRLVDRDTEIELRAAALRREFPEGKTLTWECMR